MKTYRFKSLLLAMMLSALSLNTMAYDFMVDGIAYNYNSDGKTLTVTYTVYNSSNNYSGLTTANIPASVSNYSVTAIGDHAFRHCTGLTSVTIPNSVTSIGDYAFYNCTGLTSLTIPNSVTSISNSAFWSCSSLTKLTWNAVNCSSNGGMPTSNIETVTIGNQVQVLPQGFVNGSKITSVTIPNSVTSIGSNAFSGCSGLTSLTIPNSVTSIGSNAFSGCSGLTSLTIPNSVTSIGSNAFSGCSGLTKLTWNAVNCSSNGDMPNGIETVTIGNQVQVLPNNFVNGSKITSVTIPNSVTSIGQQAFYYCSGLTSLTIGNSVTTIGSNAFFGCSGLTRLTWNAANCSSNGDMPNGIETVTIGNQVQVLPNNFVNGSKITSVTIPNSVTSIGSNAFSGCSGLTSLTIPNSVTSIGSNAFSGCSGLTRLTWNAVNCSSNGDMPNGIETVTIGNQVQVLPNNFVNGSKITSVTIPNSVTAIGSNAFSGCSGLRSINIPGSVTDIGYGAFSYCTGLMSARIANNPSNSTVVGGNAFYHCEGLTSVILPASLSALGSEAFAGCTGLTDVTCMRPRPVNIDASVFENVPVNGGCDLHVPEGSKIRYEAMAVWQDFLFIFEDAQDSEPSPTPTNGDVNGDGKVNVSDVTTLVNMILGVN